MLLYCWVIFAYVQGILHIWVDFVRGLLSYGGYWRGDFVLQSTKSHVGAEKPAKYATAATVSVTVWKNYLLKTITNIS